MGKLSDGVQKRKRHGKSILGIDFRFRQRVRGRMWRAQQDKFCWRPVSRPSWAAALRTRPGLPSSGVDRAVQQATELGVDGLRLCLARQRGEAEADALRLHALAEGEKRTRRRQDLPGDRCDSLGRSTAGDRS